MPSLQLEGLRTPPGHEQSPAQTRVASNCVLEVSEEATQTFGGPGIASGGVGVAPG